MIELFIGGEETIKHMIIQHDHHVGMYSKSSLNIVMPNGFCCVDHLEILREHYIGGKGQD